VIVPLALTAAKAPGVVQMLAAQVHPLVAAIPRFIQLGVPLLLLKLMEQSRRGVIRMLEV
jgi:hypothetical protein